MIDHYLANLLMSHLNEIIDYFQGWWQGQLRGQIGLFPDNFVEVISSKNEQEQEQCLEANQIASKIKHSIKRTERAHIRKSLDSKNIKTGNKGFFNFINKNDYYFFYKLIKNSKINIK